MLASTGTLLSSTDLEIFNHDNVLVHTRPGRITTVNGSAAQPPLQPTVSTDVGMAISNFHIQLDNLDNTVKPGEEISGKVVMDVWSPIQIRFVEFILQGRGTVRIFKTSSTFNEKPTCEIYLDKRIHLLAPPEGTRTMVLTPGKYVTKFAYHLPEDLPPTVAQLDMGKGFVFDITYMAQANVAADIKSRHISPTTTAHLVKVIKTSKKHFIVTPTHDWQSIPGALEPISHAEQVTVCCSPANSDPTSILFKLDRGVYPIGDIIKFQVEILSPKKKNIQGIMCELEQVIDYRGAKKDRQFKKVLIKAFDKTKHNRHKMLRAKFSMPLPHSLIPSFIPNCRLLRVVYHIKMTIKLKGWGGEVLMDIPIIIAPPTSLSANTDQPSVPVFNKPIMQFPYFSKSPPDGNDPDFDSISQGTSGGTLRSRRSVDRSSYHSGQSSRSHRSGKPDRPKRQDPKVTTRYKSGFGLGSCCVNCCGVGIHDA